MFITIFSLLNSMFAAGMMFFSAIAIVTVIIIVIVWHSHQQKRENKIREQQTKDFQTSMRFCRNCGARISNDTTICQRCGVKIGAGNKFCYRCGEQTDPLAVICVNCGVSLEKSSAVSVSEKSKIAAGFLGLLFGSFGIHNFYLGHTVKAIIQLFITVICLFCSFGFGIIIMSIWGFIEGIMIFAGGISKDANGALLK